MFKFIPLFVIGFWSTAALSKGQLLTLALDERKLVATACAEVETFTENQTFTHPAFKGHVIRISSDKAIFAGLAKDQVVCVQGKYMLDPTAFAPHVIVRDISIVKTPEEEAPFINELEEDDALQKVVTKIAENWNDNNITTGTSRLRAGILVNKLETKPDALKTLSEKNFVDEFGGEVPFNGRFETTAAKFSKKDVATTANALAEGNDFAPENNVGRAEFRRDLGKLLAQLGKDSSLYTLVTKSKVRIEENVIRNVYSIMFVNESSGKALRIFVIQGSI